MDMSDPKTQTWAGPVRVLQTGKTLAARLERADTWTKRFKGLLGRESMDQDTGLYLEPCRQVHCFFMKFAIDVVFVDPDGLVVGLDRNLRPWHVSRYHPKACGALELPAGTIDLVGLEEGISRLTGLKETDRPKAGSRSQTGTNSNEKPDEQP